MKVILRAATKYAIKSENFLKVVKLVFKWTFFLGTVFLGCFEGLDPMAGPAALVGWMARGHGTEKKEKSGGRKRWAAELHGDF